MPQTAEIQAAEPIVATERPHVALIALLIITFGTAALFLAEYFKQPLEPQRQEPALAAASIAEVPLEDPYQDIVLEAKAAVVLDLSTGKTLYNRNGEAQLPLASLTKVPLAIVVAEVLAMDSAIKIPRAILPQAPGSNTLAQGGVWRIRDLLDYTLVSSSNDGAEVLSGAADPLIRLKYAQAPVTDATLWRMNELAANLGLRRTYFINVTGLDESGTLAGSYGSARDMARLFAYAAATWPEVFSGTTKETVEVTSVRGGSATARNTDALLSDIPGIIIGKTGYTDLAGGNLAMVFEIGPARPIAAVVLGSSVDGRFSDMKRLIDATQRAISHEYSPSTLLPNSVQ